MRHLTIKNIGPLSSVDISLSRINLIIGPQSTGKSCILKIASFCAWLEEHLEFSQNPDGEFTDTVIDNKLINFYRLKDFIKEGERVLILDDFLASGQASLALADIVKQAGATVVGIGAVIEKGYQGGSQLLREAGYRVESLAVINEICDGKVYFDSDRG